METGHWTDNSCLLQFSLQLKKSRFRNQSLYFKGPLLFRWDTHPRPDTHTRVQGSRARLGTLRACFQGHISFSKSGTSYTPQNSVTLRGPGIQMPESVGDNFYLNHHGYLPAIYLLQNQVLQNCELARSLDKLA